MNQAPLKTPSDWDGTIYYCNSRVVDRPSLFGEEERAEFLRIMWLYEKFCHIKIMSYRLMPNHVHVLAKVPYRPEKIMSELDLVEWIGTCFGSDSARKMQCEMDQFRSCGDEVGAQNFIDGWQNRMWDISWFMKTVKQRFSQWYNRRNDRVGTLWESRYKREVIQNEQDLLRIASYLEQLETNPPSSPRSRSSKRKTGEAREFQDSCNKNPALTKNARSGAYFDER